jgi:hypothetical protein
MTLSFWLAVRSKHESQHRRYHYTANSKPNYSALPHKRSMPGNRREEKLL